MLADDNIQYATIQSYISINHTKRETNNIEM